MQKRICNQQKKISCFFCLEFQFSHLFELNYIFYDRLLAVKNEELTESPGIVVRIILKELYNILILLL